MSSNGWKTYKLGELAHVQTGPFGSQLHVSDYTEDGIPVIMPANIGDEKVVTEKIARVSQEMADSLSRHKLKIGDIVFSRRGDVERHAFIHPENEGWLCGTGCLKVAVKNGHNSRFISYQLLLPEKKKWLSNHAVGTTMPNLNTSILSALEIDLPDHETQEKIASILSSLDDKIELNRQTNATLEAIAQALFKEWFVDFNYPGATSEMVESELGIIPKGWKVGAVSELCEVNKNTISKRDSFDTVDYIEISEVGRGTIGNVTTYAFGEEPSRAKRKLKHGDIVLSTVRPDRGSYFLALHPRDNLIASTGFGVFSPTTAPYSFLYLLLTDQEKLDYYGHVAHGAAYPAINPRLILEMELAIPSDKLLEQFHRIAEPIFEAMHNNEKENHTLTQLRDGLLPRLMREEKRQ